MPKQLLSPDPLRCLHEKVVRASLEERLKGHPWPWRVVRNQSYPWYDVTAKDGHVVEAGLPRRMARRVRALARKVILGEHLDVHLDTFDKAMKRQRNRRKENKRKRKDKS